MMRLIHFYVGILMAAHCMAGEPTAIELEDPTEKLLLRDAFVVSADGSFVAGTASIEGKPGRFAYRWSRDGVHLIGDLPGGEVLAIPHGISKDGLVVVGYSSSAAGTQAFGWTEKSGMIGLGDFEGGEYESQAKGVSADGKVIVGYGTAEGAGSDRRHGDAFMWTPQRKMEVLPGIEPFRDTMWAEDVSADGSTVVGKGSNAEVNSEAFLWKQGEMVGLGSLLSGRIDFYSEAIAVSGDGSTVVGNSGHGNGQREVFIWTRKTGIKPLDKLEGEKRSNAIDVSDNGRVLGTCELGGSTVIFLWDEKGGKVPLDEKMKQLGFDMTGASAVRLSHASAISTDGRYIVGNGVGYTAGKSRSAAYMIDLGE